MVVDCGGFGEFGQCNYNDYIDRIHGNHQIFTAISVCRILYRIQISR